MQQNEAEILEFVDAWIQGRGAESVSPLRNRAAETWEPLFAVADLAGRPWLDRVVEAATVLDRAYQSETHGLSINERMLADIERVLVDRNGFVGTEDLVRLLTDDEEAEWGANELSAKKVAAVLKSFGLPSRRNRSGSQRGFEVDEVRRTVARFVDASDPLDASDVSPASILGDWKEGH